MKDVNAILQKKIYELIHPAVTAPVYYKYWPSTITADAYVLITTINNADVSTMQTSDTDTTVQIGIYSRDSLANPGTTVNDIAAAIYAVLYPNRQFTLDLSPDFQNCAIALVNDISPDVLQTGNFVYVNRFLTFRFNIFHV